MISLKLKKIKSKTIDRAEDFKKNFKKDLKNLREEVIKKMEQATTEEKNEVKTSFEEYETKLD